MARKLTVHAKFMRDSFLAQHSGRACTCAFGQFCVICQHVGNPKNQEKDDSCWTEEPDPTSPLVNDETFKKSVRQW